MDGTPSRVGGVAAILFAVAGLAWFATELAPPFLGYDDTDDPATMLAFLADAPLIYEIGGLCLIVMALTLTVTALATADRVGRNTLIARATPYVAVIAAAFFLLQGVYRNAGGPILHIAGLSPSAGEAAYIAVQLAGVQGALQAAVLTYCVWVVVVSAISFRPRALPRWLCLLAVFPALRLVGLLPGAVMDVGVVWILFMAVVPLSILWTLGLGIVLLRGTRPKSPGV